MFENRGVHHMAPGHPGQAGGRRSTFLLFLSLHREESAEEARAPVVDVPGTHPLGGIPGMSHH